MWRALPAVEIQEVFHCLVILILPARWDAIRNDSLDDQDAHCALY
jgi:hypothetical protein